MSEAFPVPRVLIAHVTDRCDLACAFCDLPKGPRDMPAADLERVLSQAREIGIGNLVITGGEPLLHPELERILDTSMSLGFGLNITTNGTALGRFAGLLGRKQVHSVSVSLDGRRETHDRLRGRQGAYDRTMEGIRALKVQAPNVALSIYAVATEVNAGELEFVYRLARDLEADFNFWPVNNKPELYMTSPASVRAYREFVELLASESEEFARRRDYYLTGLRYHGGERLTVRCLGLADQMGLSVTGDVLPCCVWEEKSLVVGNALEQGLAAVLSSGRARALRHRIIEKGCKGLCYNHSLYEFSQATGEPFLLEASR